MIPSPPDSVAEPEVAACFAYGSLMCPDIMARVCGIGEAHGLAGETACLTDYRRAPVRGEDYPGIVPAPDGRVTGVLYRGLPATAWPRLDAFEGDMYLRKQVRVSQAGGGMIPAWTYVFRPEFQHLLAPDDWDFEQFLARGKARFEARYLGFGQLANPGQTGAP